MKSANGKRSLTVPVLAVFALLAGCPLPYDYHGEGSTSTGAADPSSPKMTSPVTVTYTEEGGSTGTIVNDGTHASEKTTVVTLSTSTDNSIIYYTDDGTSVTDVNKAKKFTGSHGQLTVTRASGSQTVTIHAIAVGPNMLPSTAITASVAVSPYPVLTVSPAAASIVEGTGNVSFTITASSASTSDITVRLIASGTYEVGDATGLPASGGSLTAVIAVSSTSTTVSFPTVVDADNENEDVYLEIQQDTTTPPSYAVSTPLPKAKMTILDNSAPQITIACSPTSMNDNGPAATVTVTASFAPTSAVNVTLRTGGSYEPGDVTTLPASGGTLVVTIPAGATTGSMTFTGVPDLGEFDNESVTFTIVANSAYTIGSPGSASVTLIDTSPQPVLTLTADQTNLTDGQTATFTVHASVAPDANHTVSIGSTGYTAGKVIIPTSVTIPVGATSATFTVYGPSQIGYSAQTPTVSLATGTGHSLGSPSSLTLQITDDAIGYFQWSGVWSFNSGTGSNVGTGIGWSYSGNVGLSGGSLVIGGTYPTDNASVTLSSGSVDFDKDKFTIGVRFIIADFDTSLPTYPGRSIICAGTSYRWLTVQVDSSGNVSIDLNNHTTNMPLGAIITAGTVQTMVVNVDVGSLTLTATMNGVTVVRSLPAGFVWENPTGDEVLTSNDFSNGRDFYGTWDWVVATNGILSYSQVLNLLSTDPDLQ